MTGKRDKEDEGGGGGGEDTEDEGKKVINGTRTKSR